MLKISRELIILLVTVAPILIIGGMVGLTIFGKATPLSGIYTDYQSRQCKAQAEKLLAAKKSPYYFNRCEKETYKVFGTGKTVTRVYVVAGGVARQWEFECGFSADCDHFSGWFDDKGNSFEFDDAPQVANHDPAIYTLGCGEFNVSSINDVEIKPKLVFERGKYWWKTDYDNQPTSTDIQYCRVSGTSMISNNEVLSNLKAEYLFNTNACDTNVPSVCQTAKALTNKSVEACKYDNPTYTFPKPSDFHPQYNLSCVENYISQTGDTAWCGKAVDYGKIDCAKIYKISKL